jgi:hypothetical protein
LNYKGIKSDVALAATFDHICDCNFPSLCSANHVICVANIGGKRIVLDPTDPIHLSGTSVESIQGHSILIINQTGGEYYKINATAPQENIFNYEIALKAGSSGKSMEGEFSSSYNGISGNFLRREFNDNSKDKINAICKKHYESVFGNQTVSNLNISNSGTPSIKGKLSVNGKIINDGNNRFLFLDFLPRIIENQDRETLLYGTFLGNTQDKKVNLKIQMDEPFKTFSPISYNLSDKGVSLNIQISSPSEYLIECNYEFVIDYVFIDKKNLEIVNQALKTLKKIINEPIILKS